MPPRCCARYCGNKQYKGSGRTFHVFPLSKPQLVKEWIARLNLKNWLPGHKSLLCSDHFEEDNFDRTGQTVRLRENAVPTKFKLNPPFKQCQSNTASFEPHLPLKELEKCPSDELLLPLKSTTFTDKFSPEASCYARSTCNKEKHASFNEAFVTPELSAFCDMLPCQDTSTQITASMVETREKYQVADHDYIINNSPRKMKRKLDDAVLKISHYSEKIQKVNRKNNNLKKKLSKMSDIISELRNKLLVSESAADLVKSAFSGPASELIMRAMENKANGKISRQKYPPQLMAFALTLQRYSSRAYDYVRETFNLSLPHPTVMRQWHSGINESPGFTEEAFVSLQNLVEEKAEVEENVFLCTNA